jgi:hypothetical protein
MKIVSLETTKRSKKGYDIDGDLTLFFQFTDQQYNRLINYDDFGDIWEVLDALLAWSDDYWNLDAFRKDDRLRPSTTAYELTTETFINFFNV